MNTNMNIRERMEVVGSDGRHVGTVDHLDGNDRIKLTRDDSATAGITSFRRIGSTMSIALST
jgi:hypothetical protein